MILNIDKTIATVQIDGNMDTRELESLIRKLCILRSQMTPEVTQNAPGPDDPPTPDMRILIEDKPAMTVAHRTNGSFRFWLRNRGIGWCGYNVPLAEAILVYKFMYSKLGHLKTGTDLFSEQLGHKH